MKIVSLFFVTLTFLCTAESAVKCGKDVFFDDYFFLQPSPEETTTLVLNGVGLRKILFFQVYYGALYLEDLTQDGQDIIESTSPRVFVIHALRNLSKKDLDKEADSEFNRLCGKRCKELRPYHDQFKSYSRDVKKGERMIVSYFEDRVEVSDSTGMDYPPVFSPAYGRIMLESALGKDAADKSSKNGMLGKKLICKAQP